MNAKAIVSVVLGGLVLVALIAMLPAPDTVEELSASRVVQPPVQLNPALQDAGTGAAANVASGPAALNSPGVDEVGMTVINGVLYVITANNAQAAAAASAAAKATGTTTPAFQCGSPMGTLNSRDPVLTDFTAWALATEAGAGGLSTAAASLSCTLLTAIKR